MPAKKKPKKKKIIKEVRPQSNSAPYDVIYHPLRTGCQSKKEGDCGAKEGITEKQASESEDRPNIRNEKQKGFKEPEICPKYVQ